MEKRSSKFGQHLWRLRMERQESLSDLSRAIGASPAILSAVELGRKPASEKLTQSLLRHFKLDADESTQFLDLARQTRTKLELEIGSLDPRQKETAAVFARRFSELSAKDLESIRELLNASEDSGG